MKCFVVFFSSCIAILVSANIEIITDSKGPLASRSYTLQTRGISGKNQNSPSTPKDRSSRPSRDPSPQAQISSNEPTRRRKSPSPEQEEAAQLSVGRASKSPKTSPNGSRPPSSRGNRSPVSPARNLPQPDPQPTGDRPSFVREPSPPRRIRTNPVHQTQRRQPANAQPNTAPSQAQPIPPDHLVRARLQQVGQDPLIAKAGAEIRNGQGSVMTSRLDEHGPSALTADHVLGNHARYVASPYHTSVLATNNLAGGTTSARAAGNAVVKGRVESLDPNARGVLKVQVPRQAEVKTTIQGVGQIEMEAANYNPSAGHARIQADLQGYGWVEAQASQDRLRPDTLAAYRAAHPNFDPMSGDLPQPIARTAPARGIRRNSDVSDADSAEQSRRQRSGRKARTQ